MKFKKTMILISWLILLYLGINCLLLGFGLLRISSLHYYILACSGATTIFTSIKIIYKILK